MGKFFSAIILISILFLVACGRTTAHESEPTITYTEAYTTYYEQEPEPELPPAIPIVNFQPIQSANFLLVNCTPTRRNGFYITKRAESGRRYYFANDDDEINLNFIDTTEKLIERIESTFSLGRPPLRILKTTGVHQYNPMMHAPTINHDDINTLGWLVHTWSGGSLPIWLSVGIESMARTELGLFEPNFNSSVSNYFGDLHFTPRYWGKDKHLQAISTAYKFTYYLKNTGHLQELISSYMDRTTIYAADNMAAKLFNSFAGDVPSNFHVRMHTIKQIVGSPTAYRLEIFTDKGNYYFLFVDFTEYLPLTFDDFMKYINIMDNAIAFAHDWFENHVHYVGISYLPFSPMSVELRLGSGTRGEFIMQDGAAINRNLMTINHLYRHQENLHYHLYFIAVHEAAHLVTMRVISRDWMSAFGFGEGIAMIIDNIALLQCDYLSSTYIDNLVDSRTEGYMLTNLATWLEWLNRHNYGCKILDPQVSEIRKVIDKIVRDRLSRDEWGVATHFLSYALFHRPERLNPAILARFERDWISGNPLHYVSQHFTNHSFTVYLIDTYGLENYLKFLYSGYNFDKFEHIFGANVYQKIELWKQFLVEYMNEFGQEVMRLLAVEV